LLFQSEAGLGRSDDGELVTVLLARVWDENGWKLAGKLLFRFCFYIFSGKRIGFQKKQN